MTGATDGVTDGDGVTEPDTCVAIVPVFSALTPAEQLEVARFARPVRRARGELIVRPGEASSQLLVVHRGRAKISHVSPLGQEQLLRVLGPGDFTGESGFLTGAAPEYSVTALAPVQMCAFDHADLAALVRAYPSIAVRMLEVVTRRLDQAERMLGQVSMDVGSRLAAYLLDLPARWGAGGTATVDLPLSKKDIAALLGTTPETLSRRLAGLAEAGTVRLDGPRVHILDPGELAARAHG
ncbi:Crp/Fnr family transcriptional regulator [Pseudactinotalea sp. HY158]|uniref:Crp/Fnr family transcriptional regulator n=1 Tax=Pseudactinotalea sp. HY158 TaxID=2654547 RepID=UPI00129CACC7|nr:Crp/Fnr family transcriptional regulator [Pseudactinotalea sp. HY158]QGH70863.1 helix-turn-helix domain-containing protein [Pseudactinotalea sp. HY158]